MSWTELIEELTGIIEEAAATEDLVATFEIELIVQGFDSDVRLAGEWFIVDAGPFLEIQLIGFHEFADAERLLDIGWAKIEDNFCFKATWIEDAAETISNNVILAFEKVSISADDLSIDSVSLFGLDDD